MISFIVEEGYHGKGEFTIIKGAHVDLRLGDRMWFAHINLEGNKVERVIEIERLDLTKIEEGEGEVEYFLIEEGPVEEPALSPKRSNP